MDDFPRAPEGPKWYRELAAAWYRALRRRGRQPGTLQTYSWAIRSFGRWLQEQDVTSPQALTRQHLHGWQDTLDRRQPTSRHTACSAIRGLLRWAAREDLGVPPALWEFLDPIKIPEKVPRALSAEDLRRILVHYSRPSRELAFLRDRALFLFLFSSSSRIGAALSVRRDAFSRWIRVTVKGGHEHDLVVGKRAEAWVADYLRVRGPDRVETLWVIETAIGRRPLDQRDANRIWKRLAAELDVPKFTSHWLRGTNATELNELGFSDVDKAQHLGHRNTQTVRRYTAVRSKRREQMAEALDELVPPDPKPKVLKPLRSRHRRRKSGPGPGRPDAAA